MSEYISSEELQRHNADVFAGKTAKKKTVDTTETDKVKKVLGIYIAKHSATINVREEAKNNNRTAEYQLDLSADLVIILQKIKSELR
jgi:hypothetical protein